MLRPPPEVIVVAYGPVQLLRAALSAIAGDLIVHVVDNGLSDEAARAAERCGADYVRPAQNVGFAAAVNQGLERVQPGADVLLLNPDAQLDRAGVLALQAELHRHPRTAAVAPVLRRPDGSTEPTRWPFPSPSLAWRGLVGRGALRADEPYFVSGAVLLLSGEAVAQVGPFDEQYFLYSEESDWQRRALNLGYTVSEVPHVIAGHIGGGTNTDTLLRETFFHGSADLYARKWFGWVGYLLFRAGSFLAALRRLVTGPTSAKRRQALLALRLQLRGPASRMPKRPSA